MSRPNILVVMTDQQKATSLGLYGNPDVRTPALESLAAGGLLYRRAYTPHPLCVPARASFWTGRYPHQHGSRSNELLLREGEEHAARALHAAGYALALIGKNHCFRPADLGLFEHTYSAGHTGPHGAETDPGVAQARDFFRRHDFRPRTSAYPIDYPREQCASWLIADRVIGLLEARASGDIEQPLCTWMSLPDPHPPYAAPEPYASSFDPASLTLPPWSEGELDHKPERQRLFHALSRFGDATEVDFRRALAMYYAQVAFADDCLGRVLAALDRLDLRRDTIVVFTSDHGDYAGEHRMMTKSGAMYDCLTRVPLVVSWPGTLPEGEMRDDLVSTMDVMPTLLQLAGVPAPPALTPGVFQAYALPGAVDGFVRDAVFAEYGAGGPFLTMEAVTGRIGESLPVGPDNSGGPGSEGMSAGTRPRQALPVLRARECEGRPKMVRMGRWKYVYDPGDPVEELYDLDADPWELANLAGLPEHAETRRAMRDRLLDWLLRAEDARPVPLYYDPTTLAPTQDPHHWPSGNTR
ncbi:MAG: Arylsulfatase [uncultured Chloroflexi bacterium]|uniref:Arylsulfatase n=1 Tax=uncultured Chloroflexota bacterium TaxID=166587 RepID=A0A6J4I0V4_9CHLR|nr:MAG: Arylsulfatase [uncultured Chloroflexota bacterium]